MEASLPIRTILAEPKTTEHKRNEAALRDHNSFSLISCVNDGINLMNALRTNEVDLLLMDLLIPRMDGLLILKKLNEEAGERKPIVILLTPVISELILKEAFRLGAVYAIGKPFNPHDMVDRVYNIYSIVSARGETENKGILVTDDSVRPYIRDWLQRFEISPGILGYRFLFLAIEYYILHYGAKPSITKEVYPYVAKVQGSTSPSNVERAIRHALHSTWERCDPQKWADLLEKTEYVKKRPSNGEFISISAEKIINTMREAKVSMFYFD